MNRLQIQRGTVPIGASEADYFRFGNGERPFLILPGISLHGVTDSAEAVAEGFERFADVYTVTVLERKKDLPDDCSIPGMAEDTAEAMRVLGIRNADVFGASQGGMIGLLLAALHPEAVRRLAVGSTAARSNETSTPIFENWVQLALRADVRALNRDFFSLLYTEELLAALKDQLPALESAGTPAECARFVKLANACRTADLTPALGSISCPVLVLGAENDRVFTADASLELARALGCECYIYPHYGHAVYDEAPDYRDRLLTFFMKDPDTANFDR